MALSRSVRGLNHLRFAAAFQGDSFFSNLTWKVKKDKDKQTHDIELKD